MALNLAWSRAVVSAGLLGLALAQACGGEAEKPPLPGGAAASGPSPVGKPVGVGGASGAGGTGGSGGAAAGSGDAGAPTTDELAPIVQITKPKAVSDADDENVLVVDELEVVCLAKQSLAAGSFPVEPSTVTIELLDAEGEVLDTVEADPTDDVDEYSAHLVLTKVAENGRVGFRCSAGDAQLPPLFGTAEIQSLIDFGPRIEVDSPEELAPVALKGGLEFDFTVKPAPVADDDDGAKIDEVRVDVNGVRIELPEPDDGRYRFSVDLTDRDLFSEEPAGEIPVTIRAQNRREPEAVERFLSFPVVVDGEGPKITVERPVDGNVVGGLVMVRFTVEDELTEVDEASVSVTVGSEEYRYDPAELWERDGPTFTFQFDSTQFVEVAKLQALINVHASDEVGNRSDGKSILVYFDNVAPIIDLDPDNIRVFTEQGSDWQCSNSFDPVGPGAPSDRDVVPRLRRFRALVWEDTNHTPGESVSFYAGTDEDSAQIYLEADPTVALLIDTNGDGMCDELAPKLLEDPKDARFVDLMPIPAAGFAHYGALDPEGLPLVTEEECQFLGSNAPEMLCDNKSDLSIAIAQTNLGSKPPAIYAIAINDGAACTGIDWEYGSLKINEGWLCFAARVVDHAGNVGISPPLRLCYDDLEDSNPAPDCVTDGMPPSCTDGCSLPPAFTNHLIEN